MNFAKRTYYFFINEMRLLKRAPLPVISAIVLPMLAWLVLAAAFQHGYVEDIPVTVVDLDNSSLSRMITRYVDATQALKVMEIKHSEDEAKQSLMAGRTYIAIILKDGIEKKVKCGQTANVNVISNGACMIYTKIGYRAIAQSVMTVSSGIQIKRLEAKGYLPDAAYDRAVPSSAATYVLSNPHLSYGIYLIPGMIVSILQMSASFSSLWIYRQRRESEAGRIIPRKGHRLAYFIGKITPLLVANTLATILIYTVIFPLTGIPVNDQIIFLMLLTLLLTYVSMGMGAFVSIFFKNLVTASQLLLLINAPAFVFSGYTFPRWGMPDWVVVISNLIPVTHFLDAYFPVYIFNKPTTIGLVPLLLIGLVLWGGVFLLQTRVGVFVRKIVKL